MQTQSEKDEHHTDAHMDISDKWYFSFSRHWYSKVEGDRRVRWEKGGAKYDPIVGGCNPPNMTWWGIALIGAL